MPPIHESDQADKRWESAEWSQYELWEKIETRLRRKRGMWILATAIAFLLLAAVPVVREHAPKWRTLAETRRLSQRLNALKREAIALQSRLVFQIVSPTEYEVRRVDRCDPDASPVGIPSREKLGVSGVRFLTVPEGGRLELAGLTDRYCFSPWDPPKTVLGPDAPTAVFGLIPDADALVTDLTSASLPLRSDRVSLLWIEGEYGELRFE